MKTKSMKSQNKKDFKKRLYSLVKFRSFWSNVHLIISKFCKDLFQKSILWFQLSQLTILRSQTLILILSLWNNLLGEYQ